LAFEQVARSVTCGRDALLALLLALVLNVRQTDPRKSRTPIESFIGSGALVLARGLVYNKHCDVLPVPNRRNAPPLR